MFVTGHTLFGVACFFHGLRWHFKRSPGVMGELLGSLCDKKP